MSTGRGEEDAAAPMQPTAVTSSLALHTAAVRGRL